MTAAGQSLVQKIRLGLVTAAFLFVMLLFAPISHAGGLGFAPLALITGLAGYFAFFTSRFGLEHYPTGLPFIRGPGVIWALLLFLLWAVLTSLWSPYEDPQSLTNPVKILVAVVLFLGSFLLLPVTSLGRFSGWMTLFIAFVMLGLLIADLYSEYALSKYFFPLSQDLPEANARVQRIARANSIYQNLSHAVIVLTLLLPLVAVLLAKKVKGGIIIAGLMALVLAFLAYKANVSAALIALIMSAFFMGALFVVGPKIIDLFIGLAVLSILFAPMAGYCMNFVSVASKDNMPDSWEHRVEMWGYVAEKIAEKPIFGHGFDASRTFDKTYSGMSINGQAYEQTIVSLHPHNWGLHIWVETGAIGAALACMTLFMLRQAIFPAIKENRGMTIALVGFLAATLIICTFTYGIWQEWFWGALILIGALIPMSILNEK